MKNQRKTTNKNQNTQNEKDAEIIGLRSFKENHSDRYLDTLKSIDYEYKKTIISNFWIENLPQIPQKSENPTYLSASGNVVPKSALNATRASKVTHITE